MADQLSTSSRADKLDSLVNRLVRTARWYGRTASLKKIKKSPYAQTPEGRAAIHMIESRYPQEDDLKEKGRPLPVYDWLMREYRRGRIVIPPAYQAHIRHLMEAEEHYPHEADRYRDALDGPRPDAYLWPAEV